MAVARTIQRGGSARSERRNEMLAGYTLSCHACRHVVGGRLKHFSKHPVRYRFWTFVSKLNARHGFYAMASLVTVILTDAYIMATSAGWFDDPRFIN